MLRPMTRPDESEPLHSDRDLGMSTPISRRDIVHGAGALAALAFTPGCGARQSRPAGDVGLAANRPAGARYPPALTGLRGSHEGSFEVAHQMAHEGRTDFGSSSEPDGEYDLVIVGAGISGLAAAHFARDHDPTARILLLDNHDDFGGHAKRNEFEFAGRTILANGGSQTLQEPSKYSAVAKRLLRSLSVDLTRLGNGYHQGFYAQQGLTSAIYFDHQSFGVDRLVKGYEHFCDVDLFFPIGRDGRPVSQVVNEMPLSQAARSELIRLLNLDRDLLPGRGALSEPDYLSTVSYQHFLTQDLGIREPEVLSLLRDVPSFLGDTIETTPALDALLLGLPGAGGTSMRSLRGFGRSIMHLLREPYIHHFPDGNASVARLLVRRLIPSVAEGAEMEDALPARFDYDKLDLADSPVRIRLSSTVINVAHDGPEENARRVSITYVRSGQSEKVYARRCVLACWAAVVPHLCPELPSDQQEALRALVKTPLVYTNVLLRNWRAWKNLGVALAYCPGSWHRVAMLDFPVSLGAYQSSRDPEGPVVVHMQKTPLGSGPDRRNNFRVGRSELLGTPFEAIERNTREQLAGMLGGGGFDPAQDILALTVNRWPHGYAWSPNTLDVTEGERALDIGRRRHGRIAIANSDVGGSAYVDTAIDQAWRAVSELYG